MIVDSDHSYYTKLTRIFNYFISTLTNKVGIAHLTLSPRSRTLFVEPPNSIRRADFQSKF